jgi:hypothetical protein
MTELVEGHEGELQAMSGLIQVEGHQGRHRAGRLGYMTSDRVVRARQVSDDIGYVSFPAFE